jgi:pyruvate formate lyase activating enzyme
MGVSRRDLLAMLASGCALCAASPGWALPPRREVDFYRRLPDGRVRCGVCPRHCVLSPGQTGLCRSRTHSGGELWARGWGLPCVLELDVVEMMPLYHWRPGARALHIGVGGCNMRCAYCQNEDISQRRPDTLPTASHHEPAALVRAARAQGVEVISFGYTELVAWIEYAIDIAREAKAAGMAVIAGSALFVEPEPLLALAEHVDAFAVTLKGVDPDFHRDIVGVDPAPVFAALEALHRDSDCWIELVNLVVPTLNDSDRDLDALLERVVGTVGTGVPLHFSQFWPSWRLRHLPKTPEATLARAHQRGLEAGLDHVYITNLAPHPGNHTRCPSCGQTLVERLGTSLLRDELSGRGRCRCGARIAGVWA